MSGGPWGKKDRPRLQSLAGDFKVEERLGSMVG